jgi:hypothetical protein
MAFKTSAVTTTSNNSDRPQVDFDALNEFVVEQVGCQQPETLNGVLTGIIDLGNQKLPDAEYDVDSGDESLTVEELTDKYSADIESGKISKFDIVKDWSTRPPKEVIKKFVPQKDRQCISYCVDFPDVMLDKGKFFGENSEPKPLRLYFGGQYYNTFSKKMMVQNLLPLKITNIAKDPQNSKVWSLSPKSQLHKMAVAAKLINTGDAFLPDNIDELLGKTLQFKVQIGFNEKGDKKYYFEKLSFLGAIQRKDKPFEDVPVFLIQMDEENDPEALKGLRKHIINTMEMSTNFEGSVLQKQLLEVRPNSFKDSGSPSVVKKEESKAPVDQQSDDSNDEDDWS